MDIRPREKSVNLYEQRRVILQPSKQAFINKARQARIRKQANPKHISSRYPNRFKKCASNLMLNSVEISDEGEWSTDGVDGDTIVADGVNGDSATATVTPAGESWRQQWWHNRTCWKV